MPIYEYKGQQYDITTEDPAEAKAKILGYLEKQPPAPAPRAPDFAGNTALSPQEQAYASATPSSAGIRSLLAKPFTTPQAEPILSPEDQVMGAIGAPGAEPVIAAPKAPRPPSEARPMEELGKGVESAAKIGLPSMWEQAGVLKDVGALGTVQKRLDLFNKIETGEITSPDQLRGLDISTSQARAYFGADPAMREKIRDRTLGEIGRRKEFVSAALDTLDQYQKDSVKYKGRTTDLTDVENVKDFTNWLAYNVGSGAVQMAPIMLAAVTTGPGGVALLGTGMGTAQAVDDRLNALKDQVKDMPRNKRADTVIDYITKTGDTALAVGIINGMLDTVLGPDAALAKRGLKEVVAGETKKQALKAGVKEVPKQMAEEFLTGGAQQATQIAGQVREKEQEEFLTEKNLKDILNAAAAEAAGAVAGGAATTGARVYGAKTGEQTRAEILAKALEEGAQGATTNQAVIDQLVRQSLSPDAGVRQGTNVRANVPSLEITPPTARPGEPPAPPSGGAPIAPPIAPPIEPAGIAGLTAAPSESMDTEAMLREALGQAPVGVATLPPVKVEEQKVEPPKVDLIEEAPKYDTPDLRLKQSDVFGQDLMGVIYAEMESHGRAALKNRSLTNGYAAKKDALVDAVDAGIIAFGTNDYSVFKPYESVFPKTAAKLKSYFAAQQPKVLTEVKPTVAEAGPFVRKQMEEAAPVTPTPVSIEGALSGLKTPEAKQTEAQGQQAPAAPAERLTLSNLKDRPIEEQYTIINTVSFNAKKAFNDGRISQEQLDKIEAEKKRITQEIGEKALSNPTPEQKQALDLADQIEAAGQKDFADAIRNSVKKGIFKKDSIPFYQEKLQEFQAQQGKTEAKNEGFKWSKFLNDNEQKYYDTFQNTASPEAKAAFDNVSNALQNVVTAINNLGYQVTDQKIKLNSEADKLRTQYSHLTSDGMQLLSGHYALQKEYKRADQNKFNNAIKRANTSANNAQQLIRKAVPRPQEIAEAEQRVGEGEKAVRKIKNKPGLSLWTALTGKLGASDIAELFGKSPQVYQKKLQAQKGFTGKSIADMVSDGDLDAFLPFKMRSDVPGFDGQEAEEYIKEQVRNQNYIPYDAQVEIEQIFGSVEEAERLINDYLTTEEQNLELQEAADEQRESEINARGIEPEGEIPSAEPDEGEALTQPTPEGLKAQEEQRKAAEAAEAKAKKAAEDKAKADQEAGEFVLTGSNRPADEAAARGQKDIFAQEEEAAEEEPVNEDGVKVVPFEADSETVGNLLKATPEEENPYDIRYNALMHSAEKPAKPKPTEMLTPEEAKAQVDEWKAEAARQGREGKNSDKTIMSLFDASGEWSKPWREAGYNVWTFDIQTGEDINDFSAEYLLNEGFGDMNIWGILAAPPCTDFASSGAQFWASKDAKGQTELSNELVKQVLRTVEFLQPKIWAMENPVGRIAKLNNLPPAQLTFDPNYYGDPYTKKTLLWGNFENNLPMAPVEPTEGSKIVKLSGKDKYARSLTPEGFAYAFFMANNAESMTPAERLARTYYGVDPKAFEGATEADEKAIDSSAFQDSYYDGDLEEAANIARDIIGGQKEEAPTKTESVIKVNGRDIPVTMHKLEKENQLVKVDSNVFDKAFSKTTWQYVGEGGEGGIEGRYKKFAEFIKDAKSIEAPNVSVDKDGSIIFGDGRHRYAYLRDSGVKNIPLSMDAESIKNAEKFGYISKPEEAKPELVETPEGRNLRYPMASVLFNDGYEVLALDDPRTYVDKGGEPHRTFEKDGVRVSLTPQLVLFQDKNAVLTGRGEPTDLVINALLVDQAKRNQGKANEALQNIVDAADQYGVTLYIEPTPLVNIKEKNFGLDRQQLENLYKKFGFDFAEDSNKVMVREPEIEVLGPAEKPAAPRLTNEPYTIEGEFTEIGEEKQHALLTDQTSKLSEDQTKTLESQYGTKRGTDAFIESVRKDVIAFITQGAKAVNGKIRAIIRQLANGVLSVAIVFNPQFVSKPYTIAVPQYDIKTSEVIKDLPKEAQSMSDAAKRAYGVIYPALEKQLKEKDKLFIVADKRSGNTYLFKPDGSLLLQSKTLFGKAIGDYMHGDNEIEANRITPAGVFDLGLRDAKRSAGEAYTAGDYDFGKVFVLDKSHMGSNGPYSNTIMHSVWTHETDAKQRLAALEKPGAEDSRYSFGCINVNKETFKYLITNHLNQMDGAKIFIVPENGANVMDFINGKAMYSDDIIRQKIEPVTKTTVTEKQVPAPKPGVERKQTGRETEAGKLEVKTEEETPGKEPKEPKEQTFYDIQGYTDEEIEKRSTSLKRTIKTLNRMRKDGRITDEQFVERADAAIASDEEQRLEEDPAERKRGFLHIQKRLNEAVMAGDMSREARDLATWFMANNEDLVSDLGISIIGKGKPGQGGQYDSYKRIATIIKNGGSDLTTVHEILHHLERMMPTKIQQAIRKAWSSQLVKAAKAAKTPNEKLYFAALMDAHYGDGNIANIEIPKGAEKTYEQIKSLLEALQKRGSSEDFAMEMLKLGMVPKASYEYFNPSEFWAVNGSDIVQSRYDAVQGGVLARLKNWIKELGQKIKSLFGLKSDASIIRALDSLAKSDGKFVTREMLGEGDYYSIRNYQGNAAPTALWNTVDPSFTDGLIYHGADKQIDTKRVIERINETIGQIDERLDAYTKETLYHGRSAERILDFLEDDFRPLLKQMKDRGVTVDALEEYLHNRHAEERNEQINKINLSPDVQDFGSGIKTSDARNYLSNLSTADKAKLEFFAKKIDDIIADTQKMLVDGGLETQETIDQWNKTYKHYIPLQRDDLDFVHTGSGYVGGVGTKGSASKRAVGSIKPVKDILANIAMQRERAIRRSEQAKVGRALYALAITNPNPKFWLPVNPNAIKSRPKLIQEMVGLGLTIQDAENLIRPLQTPSVDKATGLVRYDVNPAQYNSKNVFPVRINGEDRFIIFNPKDERALRMAMSLKNLDSDQLGFVLGNIGAVTRWIASINTQYNPVFGAWNMVRDVESAAFNLSTTEIAGKEKEVLKGAWPAIFAIWKSLRKQAASSPEEQTYMDLFDQMRLAGGTTGFAQQFSGQGESLEKFVERMRTGAPKEKVNIVEQEMKRLNRGNVMKTTQKLFDWLSDYNDAMENAVRLSAFKVALGQGLSEQKAASIAKELTVNFNRKGASSPTFQALYAFVNASVQGTSRLIKTLNGPNGKKIIAGGIALGVIQAIALALNGYDDGDPPEFLKDKNFIIPIPFAGDNYITIPMPPGLNVFPGIGRILTEAVMIKAGLLKSNKGLGDKALSIGSLILDSFNPLGAGSFTQMLAPTAFDPLFAVAANKDAFGRPIYKKDMATQPTPGYERSRPTATFISQGIAEFLDWITSPVGTKHTKGLISPTADEIDYLAGQYFGGIGREVIKGVGSIKAKAEGEEVPAYKIPVVGKLYGETKTSAAISSKFYDNVSQMAEYEHEIKKRKQNKEPVAEYEKANPESKLWQQANNVENRIAKLNKEKKMYLDKKDTKNAQRIEEMRIKAMRDFNEKVKAVQ